MTTVTEPGRSDADADVLLVEDNPGDVRIIREAFDEGPLTTTLHVATDGDEALDFLHRRGDYAEAPTPDLVLLDLHLPRTTGHDVLAEIRDDPGLALLPVVVLTSSEADVDVERSYELHANACLPKPVDPAEFIETVRILEQFWLSKVRLPRPEEG